MKWPQIVMIIAYILSLGIAGKKHGESYEYNFWSTLCSTIIEILILYFGGFWN